MRTSRHVIGSIFFICINLFVNSAEQSLQYIYSKATLIRFINSYFLLFTWPINYLFVC